MKDTWASGAIELLNHADSHIDSKSAFDKRIAFISVDNAVENIVRTFLSLPKSKSGVSIKRREIDEANNSFPRLLEILYKYAGEKLIGIDDADIEHYHRIRNTLYHQGTGLSVDDQYLTAYRGIAEVLLQNLFNENVEEHPTEKISLETLILNWNRIEQEAKKEIEKHGFSTSYKWEEKFIHSHISEEIAKKISELRKARNRLVHSTEIDNEDIKFWVNKSNEILREFEKNKELFESKAVTEGKTKNPVCFVSYAWESEKHSTWVRQLAEYLQRNGVNTILDQWDLRPGMDMAHFMEKSISSSNYVLLICTPLFSQKANEGIGGVGYEKNIVTAEILKKIKPDTNIVPILRIGNDKDAIPTYLGSKKYLDFRQDNKFEQNLEELLRHIYERPRLQKPAPGQAPSLNDASSDGNEELSHETLVLSKLIHPGLLTPDHNNCVIEGHLFNKSKQKVVIDRVLAYDRNGKPLSVTWSNRIDPFGNPEKPCELIGIVDSEDIFVRQDNGEEIEYCKLEIFHSLSQEPLTGVFDEYGDWIGEQENSADP
jgi:TIR domain